MQSHTDPSRVESKLVLYGLLAGILSGVVQFIATIITISNLNSMLTPFPQVKSVFSSSSSWIIKVVIGISPLLAIIQCAFYGAIFGVIADVLVGAGLKAPIAAFISGVLYFIAFSVVPISALLITGITNETLLALMFAHPLTYLILFTTFSTLKGPWSKVFEGGPKRY